jgi:DNA repair protein RadC
VAALRTLRVIEPSASPPAAPRRRRRAPGSCTTAELVATVAAIRPRDAGLEAAHRLLLPGGLWQLSGASAAELAEAAGIGARGAARLVAAFELGRRAASDWPERRWRVRTPADVADRLVGEMGHLEREELRVLALDMKHAVLAVATVYVGNVAGSPVRVGEVFRDAIRRNAAAIVVAHNHPSGDPAPSADDLQLTGDLANAGRLLDIELLDHVVIGHGRWVSLRAIGGLT